MRKCKYCGKLIQEPPKSEEICIICKNVYQFLSQYPNVHKKMWPDLYKEDINKWYSLPNV